MLQFFYNQFYDWNLSCFTLHKHHSITRSWNPILNQVWSSVSSWKMGPLHLMVILPIVVVGEIPPDSFNQSLRESDLLMCQTLNKCESLSIFVLVIIFVIFSSLCVYCFCCFEQTPKPNDVDTFIPDSSYWWRKIRNSTDDSLR